MIPVGYMYKTVSDNPDWLKTNGVKDIYSVSGCVSDDFDDWIDGWQHNGYWLFNSPEIMQKIADKKGIDLSPMTLFFYQASEQEWCEFDEKWGDYQPEQSFTTAIKLPKQCKLAGFDVVSFFTGTTCECSPLSCYHLAESTTVNEHCLLDSYEAAIALIQSGQLRDCAEGPYRIFAVYLVTEI